MKSISGGVRKYQLDKVSNQPISSDRGARGLPVTNLKGLVSRSPSDILEVVVKICGGRKRCYVEEAIEEDD